MALPYTQDIATSLSQLPANTQILGIHQSDITLRTAIILALADMRANPWLVDYTFASLLQDPLTYRDYGKKELDEAKKWFLSTDISVETAPIMDEARWPKITIELLDSTEVPPEATIGDIHSTPWEDTPGIWPAQTSMFTPGYNPVTGILTIPATLETHIFAGMVVVDRTGKTHEILEVVDDTHIRISPSQIADFTNSVLKSAPPAWKTSIESSSFKESYRIGIHVPSEVVHVTRLHAIVQFALQRYKQILLEARGFERSTISSGVVALEQRFETENVITRYITMTGYVRQYWPKIVAPTIDGVDWDTERGGLMVSGVGGEHVSVRTAGVDPNDVSWIGDLDGIRSIK